MESNHRPFACEANALPLSHRSIQSRAGLPLSYESGGIILPQILLIDKEMLLWHNVICTIMGGKIVTFLVDIAETVILAFCIFLVTYIWLFRPFQVSGLSMYPTFDDKQYILTNLIALRFEKLKLGDVVVFLAPNQDNTEFKKDFIKRIIGVPGDTILLKDGDAYRNGQKLNESAYLKNDIKTYGGAYIKDGMSLTVPANSYIVFGDNRPYSSDSREWGFVTDKELIGKSLLVYYPLNKMELIKNPYQ